jgi:hypothetical protein
LASERREALAHPSVRTQAAGVTHDRATARRAREVAQEVTRPAPRQSPSRTDRVLDLQRAAGNRAVAAALEPTTESATESATGPATVQRHVGPTSPAEVSQPGTGTGTGPDYAALATQIRDAVDGLGTDEAAIYAALEQLQRDVARITALRVVYVAVTGRSLDADLRGDLSGGELARAMTLLTPKSREELIREAMATTARGAWALVVIAVFGVDVDWAFTGQGSYHQGGKIFLNQSLDVDAAAIVMIHEAQHAYTYKTGATPDVATLTRQAYVDAMIADEAEAVVKQIEGAAPMQRAGRNVSAAIGTGLITQYQTALATEAARLQGLDASLSEADARSQARTTVRDGLVTNWFHDGTFVTSTGLISYADHYGNFWDSQHTPPATPAPVESQPLGTPHPVSS